ncbi:c-type cytochrome [Sphingomonas sp. MMS24-J13]|uniref:c-type cytochrome n=1 Tax=Sphingomonas sp. MMS24-J13 TaxID=3238686 RepID=UPI0038503D58
MMRLRMLTVPALALIASLGAADGEQPGASTARGAYTAAQATEGATLYKGACAMCHGESLAGTFEVPPLTGLFVARWSNGSVGALFDYVSNAMPQMAPGSLSPDDNAKIVAYLLQANGMPAGTKPLSTDAAALKAIAFEPVKH